MSDLASIVRKNPHTQERFIRPETAFECIHEHAQQVRKEFEELSLAQESPLMRRTYEMLDKIGITSPELRMKRDYKAFEKHSLAIQYALDDLSQARCEVDKEYREKKRALENAATKYMINSEEQENALLRREAVQREMTREKERAILDGATYRENPLDTIERDLYITRENKEIAEATMEVLEGVVEVLAEKRALLDRAIHVTRREHSAYQKTLARAQVLEKMSSTIMDFDKFRQGREMKTRLDAYGEVGTRYLDTLATLYDRAPQNASSSRQNTKESDEQTNAERILARLKRGEL